MAESNNQSKENIQLIAAVRIRGSINVKKDIKDTLSMLRLFRVNHCVLVPNNADFTGMLKKTKEYITWGEINQETLEKLVLKRGRTSGNKKLDKKDTKEFAKQILKNKSLKGLSLKPVFRLSPPSKGYKSIRKHYPKGALGYRKEKINDLLKRMI